MLSGYDRKDGRKGVRNLIVVAYLVECARHVAERIAAKCGRDDVHVIGFSGCAPCEYAERVMTALCTHPNVGAALVVSLGCENFHRDELVEAVRASGREAALVVIQDEGGTEKAIASGLARVERMLKAVDSAKRVPMDVSELVVGTICGGSDAYSGKTANPAVGKVFDRLVDEGATCIFEEPGELIGCEELLRARGATPETGDALAATVAKADAYYKKMGHDSISRGNFEGGLASIIEKSRGAYKKSGSRTISGIIKPGETPPARGLWFMDVVPDGEVKWGFPNLSDTAEIVELASCGAHLVMYTTGRGSVAGCALVPVIKVCANPETFRRMADDMDVNAGVIATGERSENDVAEELYGKVLEVANGAKSRPEALGHREFFLGYKSFECRPGNVARESYVCALTKMLCS